MSEKEQISEKFAVNQASAAGIIISVKENPNKAACNVTIMVNDEKGDNAKPKFLNAYISGEERFKNFMESYNQAKANDLGSNQLGKQYQPAIHVTGVLYFSTNETNGIKNQNASIIVQSDCKEKTDKYQITTTKEELLSFRKEFDNTNPKVNNVEIRADIATDPQVIKTKSGAELNKFNIKHNYIQNETKKTSFAQVLIPPALKTQLKAAQVQKGIPIQLNAKLQPSSYLNKDGKSVNTFTLVAKSISRDFAQTVSTTNAIKAVDKVAEVSKKTERLKEAKVQKEILKPSKQQQT